VVTLSIWVVVDGLGGYRFVANEAPRVSPYADVGRRIAASLDDAVPIFGSQRWWWALHPRPYRSLTAQWQLWEVEYRVGHQPDFRRLLSGLGGAYLIVDNDTRSDLARMSALLREQVAETLTTGAVKVAAWHDATYGLIEIYRL
jgi:hypothetical protein